MHKNTVVVANCDWLVPKFMLVFQHGQIPVHDREYVLAVIFCGAMELTLIVPMYPIIEYSFNSCTLCSDKQSSEMCVECAIWQLTTQKFTWPIYRYLKMLWISPLNCWLIIYLLCLSLLTPLNSEHPRYNGQF